MINCAVIIVRYFGGTKLDTGGLVRAYSTVTKELVSSSKRSLFTFKEAFELSIPYNKISRISYFIEQERFDIIEKEFAVEYVKIKILLNSEEEKIFKIWSYEEPTVVIRTRLRSEIFTLMVSY